ncbi:MAG: MepB family protein [Microvirga sp.]
MICGLDISKATIPRDLVELAKHVFAPIGLTCSKVETELESREYGAVMLELGHLSARFRVAKITPRKVGQFVTIWKRIGDGPIQPFDETDPVDLVVIQCRSDHGSGQFVFPKAVLCRWDVFSKNGTGGKRAIRVYPPWDRPTSQQAVRSQAWQREYFMEMPEDRPVDRARARALYGID